MLPSVMCIDLYGLFSELLFHSNPRTTHARIMRSAEYFFGVHSSVVCLCADSVSPAVAGSWLTVVRLSYVWVNDIKFILVLQFSCGSLEGSLNQELYTGSSYFGISL